MPLLSFDYFKKLKNPMASSITPNIPNVPDSSGPAIHPAVPTVIAGTAAVSGATNAAMVIERNEREIVSMKQSNREQFHMRAKASIEDCPKPDSEVREQIIKNYLETGGVTRMNPEEATADLQKYNMIDSDQKVVAEYHGLSKVTRGAIPAFGKANFVVRETSTSSENESKLGSNPPESLASISVNKQYQTKSYRGMLAAANGEQGCAPPKVLYQAPIAPSLQSYIVSYLTVAALLYTIVPPFFKKAHRVIHSWLGLKNTNVDKLNKQEFERVLIIIESYNKKSLHEKQARLLLANLSLFTEQEIDQFLNLRSDKLP